MAFSFKDWLFNQFPEYYAKNDSYKDSEGKGLLQRYLMAFGLELDEEIMPFLNNFQDIFDLKTTPDKFLAFLGFLVGSPPDIDGTSTTYRKLLSQIIDLYQIKGIENSYKLLFNLMGLDCFIIQYPKKTLVRYDSGNTYDDGISAYDLPCEPCQEYDIGYWDRNDDCSVPIINTVPPDLLDNIKNVICWLQPIDAKLLSLSRVVHFCEPVASPIAQQLSITRQRLWRYDDSNIYDGVMPNAVKYDEFHINFTQTYNF